METSFDYNTRSIHSGKTCYQLEFISSLISDDLIALVCAGIELIPDPSHLIDNFFNGSITKITLDKKTLALLSGNAILTVEDQIYEVDVRKYPSRSINEPETEKSVRGAKDGFVEQLLTNTGLIRRRIRNPDLCFEKMTIGNLAPIDICLCYDRKQIDKEVLKDVKNRLAKIQTKDLVMSDRALEELLIHQIYNPFPLVRYSERPDIVSAHIVQGHLAIITDTSASVMMLPTSLPEILEHVEEHRQVPIIGTFIRLLRLFAVFLSVYLVPFWILTLFYQRVDWFVFAKVESFDFNHLMVQVLLVELTIELLRLATIHTPTGLSSALGFIAAILLGEFAIELGLFIPEILLYSALSNVAGFATPNYELSLANKYLKLLLLLLIWIFKAYGFVLFNFTLYYVLANLKLFKQSYLYPFIPFNFEDLFYFFIRKPKTKNKCSN